MSDDICPREFFTVKCYDLEAGGGIVGGTSTGCSSAIEAGDLAREMVKKHVGVMALLDWLDRPLEIFAGGVCAKPTIAPISEMPCSDNSSALQGDVGISALKEPAGE